MFSPAQVPLGLLANLRRSLAFLGGTQLYARPPRFGKGDGDRLFCISSTVLTLADVVHFLTYEFTRLCAGLLSLLCIFSGSFNRLFLGHKLLSYSLIADTSTGHRLWLQPVILTTFLQFCGIRSYYVWLPAALWTLSCSVWRNSRCKIAS